MSVGTEIYWGNVGSYDKLKTTLKTDELGSKIDKANQELSEMLSVDGLEKYKKLTSLIEDLHCEEMSHAYEYGLSIGICLGYESKKRVGE